MVFSGLSDAVDDSADGALSLLRAIKLIIGLSSLDSFLCSFRQRFKTIDGTEMADVEQTQKMIPFITREISLCQHVCELVFDVKKLLIRSKKPVKSNSVGSGNLSHCRASSLYDHFDHCFSVFKHIQHIFLMRRVDV